MHRLQHHFQAAGLRVYLVPEAATLLWASGSTPADLREEEARIAFQVALMRLQLQLEDSIAMVARATRTRAILLCDRGLLDGKAYVNLSEWLEVLRLTGVTEELAEQRYDCVMHLVTAADGASNHYSFHDLRRETLIQATLVDQRTKENWSVHPRRTVVDNSTDMEGKLSRVVSAVEEMMKQPPGAARRLAASD
jgi:hypothetical protein